MDYGGGEMAEERQPVSVKYLPGDKVWINGDIPAHIDITQLRWPTDAVPIYKVVYWHEGKREECWCDEFELRGAGQTA